MNDLVCFFNDQHKTFKIYDARSKIEHDYNSILQLVKKKRFKLEKAGLGKESTVLLYSSQNVDFFINLFALWSLNCIPFITNSTLTQVELDRLCSYIKPRFIIKKNSLISKKGTSAIKNMPPKTRLVLFTSGSANEPKAIIHTEKSLLNRLESINKAIPVSSRKRSINFLPLSFGHGLIGICLSAIYSGQYLILTEVLSINNVNIFSDLLHKKKPTFISATPSLWEIIVNLVQKKKLQFKRIQIASAFTSTKLQKSLLNWGRCPCYNVYGMTECASWISDYRIRSKQVSPSIGNGKKWETEFRIKNDRRSGQLQVKTSGLMWGYWNKEKKFSSMWLKTDDIARIDLNGNVTLIGRTGRVINKNGLKVSAEEIEQQLMNIPAIKEALVVSTDAFNSDIKALVVLDKQYINKKKLYKEQILISLKKKMSLWKIPDSILIITKIPKKINGKYDLKKAKELFE